MEEQIRLEAYYIHLKNPHQSDVENWLQAEKKIKNTRKELQQFYERYRIVYKKHVIDKTKIKDCPPQKDKILFIVRKNNKIIPDSDIHRYCLCKNMNRSITSLIEKVDYSKTRHNKYIII